MYLHMKLFDYITTIELWDRTSSATTSRFPSPRPNSNKVSPRFEGEPDLVINKIRIHYFFTRDEQIDSLLKDTKVILRLTTGPSWNSRVLASSNTFPLKGLNIGLMDTAQKAEVMAGLFVDSAPQLFGYLRVNSYLKQNIR